MRKDDLVFFNDFSYSYTVGLITVEGLISKADHWIDGMFGDGDEEDDRYWLKAQRALGSTLSSDSDNVSESIFRLAQDVANEAGIDVSDDAFPLGGNTIPVALADKYGLGTFEVDEESYKSALDKVDVKVLEKAISESDNVAKQYHISLKDAEKDKEKDWIFRNMMFCFSLSANSTSDKIEFCTNSLTNVLPLEHSDFFNEVDDFADKIKQDLSNWLYAKKYKLAFDAGYLGNH